MMTDR